jgi:hypothetical protein
VSAATDQIEQAEVHAVCRCGAPATSGSARLECSDCFRERLGTINSGFAPTRSGGAGQVDPVKSRRWGSRLEDYRRTRAEGSQPRSTRRRDIDLAKRASDIAQAPVSARSENA